MTNPEADLHHLAHLEGKMQVSLPQQGDTQNGGCCGYSRGGPAMVHCLEPGSSTSTVSDALVSVHRCFFPCLFSF
jgi:hypothetical protein